VTKEYKEWNTGFLFKKKIQSFTIDRIEKQFLLVALDFLFISR